MSTARPSKIVPRPGDVPPAPRPAQSKAAEKKHKDRVAQLGCILCWLLGQPQSGKTDLHHVREGQGMAQRASDFLVIPLCHDGCHQGKNGIHGDRALFRIAKVKELDLLALTIGRLEGMQ